MSDQPTIKADICIIGAGSGGLSVASGAAQLGLKTVLIEMGEMGGDCLNTGCVPSKAFLAASKRAQMHRKNDIKGIQPHEPIIDYAAINDHVMDTIATIEPHDSQERFEKLGVHVIRARGEFIDNKHIRVGDDIVRAKKFVIATGARPAIPPIEGLQRDKVLTNDTIFTLREKPNHLLIVGGGSIGLEMAQAHKRLGCDVSVFDMGEILPRDDRDNVEIIRQSLINDGVNLYENSQIKMISHVDDSVIIKVGYNGQSIEVQGTHILIATGRAPNVERLALDRAGVKFSNRGIDVDNRLRTSQSHIYAIGDVVGGAQFTHVAGYHAGLIIKQTCFKIPAKVDYTALPWVTYLDPEIAQVGMIEEQAIDKYGDKVKTVEWSFGENDRAIAERQTMGKIRIVTVNKGRIIGVSIVGAHAGELIAMWGLAISQKLKISSVANMMLAYPTLSEVGKRAAGSYYTTTLFSNKTRCLVRWLQKLPF